MEPYDETRFHLVISHGIKDTSLIRQKTKEFWRMRFPRALITSFAFLDDHSRWGCTGLLESAQSLLLAAENDRKEAGILDQYLPCVLLCHDLGGSLVKQALLLALQDRRYSWFSADAAILILFGTPDGADFRACEHQVFDLLFGTEFKSVSPSSLIMELPTALERLYWEFYSIQSHYTVVEVTNAAEANRIETNVRMIKPRARTTLAFPDSSALLWNFTPGETVTEKLFDLIDQAVKLQLYYMEDLSSFMRTLSKIDVSDDQVNLSESIQGSLRWITEHSSYEEWNRLDREAPSILYIHGPAGTGSAVVASHLFFTLSDAISNSIVLGFSFSRRTSQVQPITTCYVSLIRQLLRNRPWLFRRISEVSKWITDEGTFSDEILRSLCLSLLKRTNPKSVWLVVHGVQHCYTFLDHIASLRKDIERLSTGIFKVVILDKKPRNEAFGDAAHFCRDINLDDQSWRKMLVASYIRPKIDKVVGDHPQWKGHRQTIHEKLCQPSSLLHAALALRFLEKAMVPSTKSAATDFVDKFPLSFDTMRTTVLEQCQNEIPFRLSSLLQWIIHSVRPLSLSEVAVVTALLPSETVSLDYLKFNIPLALTHDLRSINGILIRLVGLQVHPIDSTIGSVLAQQWAQESEDPDGNILSRCLDYLEATLVESNNVIGCSDSDTGSLSALPAEFDLLEYAVTFWPHHYRRASCRSQLKPRVQEFFSKESHVNAWFELYRTYADFPLAKFPVLDNLLKIACKFGLLDLAEDGVQQAHGEESIERDLSQSLDLAVGYGHDDVVALLLRSRAESPNAICLAAEGGYLNILQRLIITFPQLIEAKDNLGRAPFAVAASYGKKEIVSYLLAKGASYETASELGPNAIYVASRTGQSDIIHSLVNTGMDIKSSAQNYQGALRLAAGGGCDDIVALLLENQVNIDGQDKEGMTALHMAASHGHASTCDILLQRGANIYIESKEGMSPIHFASKEGHLEIVQQLLSMTTNANSGPSHSDRSDDVQSSAPTIVFNPTSGVLSPLHLAASHGHLEVVRELLESQTYSSVEDRAIALLLAAAGGFTDVVEELLKSKITVLVADVNGNTALHLAAQRQFPDVVEQLLSLSNVFDINAPNASGWTPLHLAARAGRILTLQVLLDHDARPDGVTNALQTVLHVAVNAGHVLIAKELLHRLENDRMEQYDMRLRKDEQGDTALMLAVRGGHLEIARALLQRRTSPSPDSKHIAAEYDRESFIRLLLDSGWDIDARDGGVNPSVLHLAADSGHVAMIRLLVDVGADINAKDGNGETPLHRAVNSGAEVVKAILEAGADMNAEDETGTTPLWHAAYRGHTEVVEELLKLSPNLDTRKKSTGWTILHAAYDNPAVTELLLSHGANPDAPDKNGDTAFLNAADFKHGAETVRRYLNAGVDPNQRSRKGLTALHLAAENGSFDTVELLLTCEADPRASNDDGEAPIHLAALNDHADVVEYLLEQGADAGVDCDQYGTPLMAASSRGSFNAAKALLARSIDVNATSDKFSYRTALQAAASVGSESIVKALLDAGADINITGGTYCDALCAAVTGEHFEVARLLLDAGANIDYSGEDCGPALQIALSNRCSPIVDLCLQRGADVNVVSEGRHGTALIAAIESGDMNNVERLLQNGADANLFQRKNGETPAQVAVRKGRRKILKAIVKRGAKLDYQDQRGRGALSHAIAWKSNEILSYLCDQPLDINQVDDTGRTPLILAVIQGSTVVEKLVERNAKLNVQDRWGKTALMHAASGDYSSGVSTLINGGADLLIKDIRGRDALYWAALGSSLSTFNLILKSMQKAGAPAERFQHAVNAAAAVERADLAKKLLEAIQYSCHEQEDEDGWTAYSYARRYHCQEIQFLLRKATRITGNANEDSRTGQNLKIPTEWHPEDMAYGLLRGQSTNIITVGDGVLAPADHYGTARANHPAATLKGNVYYFEVRLEKSTSRPNGKKPVFSVGFSEENSPLNSMLGWQGKSVGYQSDNGNIYRNFLSHGAVYGEKYGEGDTIGCGVIYSKVKAKDAAKAVAEDVEKNVSFFTKNGQIIGRAFSDLRGKLFPAVSVDKRAVDCIISAKFPYQSESERGYLNFEGFQFKGSFEDPKIYEESRLAREEAQRVKTKADGDSDSSDDSDGDTDGSEEESYEYENGF